MSIQSRTTQSEQEQLGMLIASAASGDESAWVQLINLYSHRVFAMARSRLHDDELAEEITQSVFVTVASKLISNESNDQGSVGYTEQGRFEPWLFRITMNRVRDLCRKRTRHARPTDPEQFTRVEGDDDRSIGEQEESIDKLSKLRQAMNELPESDRELIELRHHGQMSFKQIAECTGDPIGTLLARHHRALKKLRVHLEAIEQNDQSAEKQSSEKNPPKPTTPPSKGSTP